MNWIKFVFIRYFMKKNFAYVYVFHSRTMQKNDSRI